MVAATMSGLKDADYGGSSGTSGAAGWQATDADNTGGRSKCMPAPQLARSGRRVGGSGDGGEKCGGDGEGSISG